MEQIKFELIEKYNEETAKTYELQSKVSKQVSEAQALVSVLTYRHEQALKAAVLDNAENQELVDELSEQLHKAKRDLENKKKAQQIASLEGSKRTITDVDVMQGLADYQRQYQIEIIAPALRQLRKAKEAYINEFLDVMRKIQYFDEQTQAAYLTIKPNTIGKPPYSVGFGTLDNVKHKCLTDADLLELGRGQKPNSLKPIKKPVKNAKGHIVFVPVDEEGEE
jgi:hypothetical protein